jgi:RHS repeat-associated protein
MDYNSSEYVVIPHKNWRGEYGAGTNTSGTNLNSTFNFEWPADFRGAFFSGDDNWGDEGLADWFGGLIQDQADQTGLMYKRNRYYDPNTGRFTQEDPIGLAGGLNLYGFANGDPVNFSDPFGLCPPQDDNWGPDCERPVLSYLLGAIDQAFGTNLDHGLYGSTFGKARWDGDWRSG